MFKDATGFSKVYIAVGYTDLRHGIDGLANIVYKNFGMEPFQKNVLFLFCGKRADRCKGLLWEGDGFLLLYKRLEVGAYQWPRTTAELLEINEEQYRWLMSGLQVVAKRPILEVNPECIA